MKIMGTDMQPKTKEKSRSFFLNIPVERHGTLKYAVGTELSN